MYNTVEHAAMVELLVEDVDIDALFAETLLALRDALSDANGETAVTHEVSLRSGDLSGLLVEWVNELIRLAEEDGFVPERIDKEWLDETSLRARVAGERGVPPAEIRDLSCRSVGLHQLDDGAWAARIKLDTARG
ncbi:MAG: archease [Solirubrobacterales bacterium]|nr:archease [Solirubrobacterales bacterium]